MGQKRGSTTKVLQAQPGRATDSKKKLKLKTGESWVQNYSTKSAVRIFPPAPFIFSKINSTYGKSKDIANRRNFGRDS